MSQAETPLQEDASLLDDWRESFLLALTFTGRALQIAFERFVGAQASRLQLLGILSFIDEISQADLQRHMKVDGATITRQVKQMESEGLLQRRADPKDNRFTLVMLTDAGRELVRALMRRGLEFERLALRDVEPEQIACAVELLARMRQNIQAMAEDDGCLPRETSDTQR